MKIKFVRIIISLCAIAVLLLILPQPAVASEDCKINDDSKYTNNTKVTLKLKYQFGNVSMKVFTRYNGEPMIYEGQNKYKGVPEDIFKSEKSYSLDQGDGLYEFYVMIYNFKGNGREVSTYVRLDREAPTTPAARLSWIPAKDCIYVADPNVFQYPDNVSINKQSVGDSFTAYVWVRDDSTRIKSVKFPVWTEHNGQDDLIWYEASDTGYTWNTYSHLYSCTIKTSQHNNEGGKYNIHAYGYDLAGNMGLLSTTTVTIDKTRPTIAKLSAPAHTMGDSFTVYAEGVADSGSRVARVKFPVWTESNGQDDIIWHEGTYDNASGNWFCTINKSEHNNETGSYIIHAYAYDNAGNTSDPAETAVTVDQPLSISGLSAPPQTKEDSYTVYAEGVADNGNLAGVQFSTWTKRAGQDDLKQCEGQYDSASRKWYCTVNKSEHKNETGEYITHAYAYDEYGNRVGPAVITVTIDQTAPTIGRVTTTVNQYTRGNSYTVFAYVTTTDSLASVKFPSWTQNNGQDDIIWHEGEFDDFRRLWRCTIDKGDHKNETGKYITEVYAYDESGNVGGPATITMIIDQTAPTILSLSAPQYTKEDSFTVYAEGVADADSGVDRVEFAVWTDSKGQDDIVCHRGEYDSASGKWYYTVKKNEHKNETGRYIINAYAYDKVGIAAGAVSATVIVDQTAPTISGLSALQYTQKDSYTVYAEGVSDPGGEIASIKFATWTEKDGQDDIIWSEGAYDLVWERWYCIVNKKEHKDETGKYITHAYVYDKAGMEAGPAMASVILDQTPPTATAVTTPNAYTNEDSFTVYAEGVNDSESGISYVKFPVWTENNGQDDIIEHQGKYDSASGKWYCTVNRNEHKYETGKYNIEGYAYDKAGNYVLVGSATVTIDKTYITAPVLTTKAQTIDADTINIEGSAAAGLTIKISRDGSLIATGKAGTDGKFSVNIILKQNTVNTLSATAGNGAGKESAASTVAITEDSMGPTAVISTSATDPTSISPIPITISFSEAVNGFSLEDITVENGTTGIIWVSGTSFTTNITPLAPGTVTVNIAAGVARSAKGHANTAAKQFSIRYEIPIPIIWYSAPAVTNAATPTISTEPSGTTVSVGGTADLSVTASVSQGTLSYQWYRNTVNSNSGGELITGATDAAYSAPTASAGVYYYYCIITNTDNTATGNTMAAITSQAVTVTVNVLTNAETPTITAEPEGITVSSSFLASSGLSAYVFLTASVSQGSLSYQWYSNTSNSNSGGNLILGATDYRYVVPTDTPGTYYYYCIVTNTDNTATVETTATITSNVAIMIVNP